MATDWKQVATEAWEKQAREDEERQQDAEADERGDAFLRLQRMVPCERQECTIEGALIVLDDEWGFTLDQGSVHSLRMFRRCQGCGEWMFETYVSNAQTVGNVLAVGHLLSCQRCPAPPLPVVDTLTRSESELILAVRGIVQGE